MKIGLAAGHTRNTEGERLKEHTLCWKSMDLCAELLSKAGKEVVLAPDYLYDLENNMAINLKVRFFNDQKVDLAVEFHLNRFNAQAQYGVIVYCRGSESGKALANTLTKSSKVHWPWTFQPPSPRHDLAFINKTTMPSVITEPGFMDEAQWKALKEEETIVLYATTIALGLIGYERRDLSVQ